MVKNQLSWGFLVAGGFGKVPGLSLLSCMLELASENALLDMLELRDIGIPGSLSDIRPD